jgi:hypothetical protein
VADLACRGVGQPEITLGVFLIVALYFPDALAGAREEVGRVVGRSRLPSFSDKKSLPYVRAFILEVQRWRPVILISPSKPLPVFFPRFLAYPSRSTAYRLGGSGLCRHADPKGRRALA